MQIETSEVEIALRPGVELRGLFSLWGLDLECPSNSFSRAFSQMILEKTPLQTSSESREIEFIVLIEPPRGQRARLKRQHPDAFTILVVLEPKAVRPDHHRRRTWKKYDLILHLSKMHGIGNPKARFWETGFLNEQNVVLEQELSDAIEHSKPRVGLINANKYSFVQASNYALRSDFARLALRLGIDLKVAGKDWHLNLVESTLAQIKTLAFQLLLGACVNPKYFRTPIYKNRHSDKFLGEVDSSIEFLRRCDVAVIIENDSTYVSEKLYNAILAGTFPIYVGPSLACNGLPAELALEVSHSPSSIIDAILSVNKDMILNWRSFRRTWLEADSTFNRWSETQGIQNLVNKILEILNAEFDGKRSGK
jgi:hypothetical protein